MSLRRLLLMGLVALVLVGISYVVVMRSGNSPAPAQASIGLEDSIPSVKTKSTNELLAFWRGRTEKSANDFISLTFLGQTLMREGRETGNVANYVAAETAFRQALSIDPKYENAEGYLASDLFAIHDFKGALDIANAVYAQDPHAILLLATIGDAQMELGNYDEAYKAFRDLYERAPSPPVYARLARMAWLHGDTTQAVTWMQRAVDEAQQQEFVGEEAAWYEFQLGELEFNQGQVDTAEKHYNVALELFNHYYLALAGMGKVRAAQGRYADAIAYYEQAVAIIPQPDLLAALGDLYFINGQPDKAKQQYDTVQFIGKLAAINQQVYNRQLALFDANHDRNLEEALMLAKKEATTRKDIYGYDALAWTLYKNGQYQQAAQAMDQAMKLGTRDALLYYHAGMINARLGDSLLARELLREALTINPHFDLLQSRVAEATLQQSE